MYMDFLEVCYLLVVVDFPAKPRVVVFVASLESAGPSDHPTSTHMQPQTQRSQNASVRQPTEETRIIRASLVDIIA
jgi:hypothetical protein